jgi:hypothetical protein
MSEIVGWIIIIIGICFLIWALASLIDCEDRFHKSKSYCISHLFVYQNHE